MDVKELLREADAAPTGDFAARVKLAHWYRDHGQPERAEFVDLQVEALRFGDRTHPSILERAADLLKVHEGAWRTVGCSECKGSRQTPGGGTCLVCDGLGDAGGLVTISARQPFFTLPVVWRGGTPHAIVCKLFEAFQADGVPTRWAFRAFAHHPTLREVRFGDRDACEDGGLFWWRAGDRDACEADAQRVPRPLLEAAAGVESHTGERFKKGTGEVSALGYEDRHEGFDTLAAAAGALVRATVAAAKTG